MNDQIEKNDFLLYIDSEHKSLALTSEMVIEQSTNIQNNELPISKKFKKKDKDIIDGVANELLNEPKRILRKKNEAVSYFYGEYNDTKNKDSQSSSEYGDQRLLGKKKKYTHRGKSTPKKQTKAPKIKESKLKRKKKAKNVIETLEDQVNFLLQWKNEVKNNIDNNNEKYKYYDLNSLDSFKNIKWKDDISLQNAQAVLICPPWNYCNKGYDNDDRNKFTFEDFTACEIPFHLIEHGIIFIWTKKEYVGKMFKYFKHIKNTKYIENLVWGQLEPSVNDDNNNAINVKDENKKIKTDKIRQCINIDSRLHKEGSTYFSNSYLTLLFFLRKNEKDHHLELRHQRTCDAVFDYYSNYIYIYYANRH